MRAPTTEPARIAPINRGFHAFRTMIATSFVPMSVTAVCPETFWSRTRSAAAETLTATEITASAHAAHRDLPDIDPRGTAYVKVNVQLAGTGLLAQNGRQARLRPGDLAIYDTQRPFSLAFDEDSRSLVVMMPKDSIGLTGDVIDQLTAVTISGHHGVGNVVVPFLAQLANNLEQLRTVTGARLAGNVVDLLSTTLSAQLGLPDAGRDRAQQLFDRVVDYIDIHLADTALTPDRIAAAHYVSTRRLHAIFQAEGTSIAAWVRTRRLERCRRDLRDPALGARSISTIATRWGFPDSAHFSRIFKAYTGVAPSEFRATEQPRFG